MIRDNDLISRDDILVFIETNTRCQYLNCQVCEEVEPSLYKICYMLQNMPDAYDVDTTVAELNRATGYARYDPDTGENDILIKLDDAEDIVRRGGTI